MRLWQLLLSGLFSVVMVGCAGETANQPTQGTPGVIVDLDRANQERLLRYYFGTYAPRQARDPFETGLLRRTDAQFLLNIDSLVTWHPTSEAHLRQVSSDGLIDWDDLVALVSATYYTAADALPTLSALQAAAPYKAEPESWFSVEVNGVMSVARRTVYIRFSALRAALRNYRTNSEQLLYPIGTFMIGEHHLEGVLVETTVMQKRPDGFWDFWTYGQGGNLAATTQTEPRQLKSPTQCVGCHFGTREFEPERSFPEPATDGPHGPRALHVPEALRDAEVTAFFDEHRKRSDTVLGLYNTLFVAQLKAQRGAGAISQEDAALLDTLGL